MEVRLSALSAGCHLPPERFLVLILVRGSVGPWAIVQLEGLDPPRIQLPPRECNPRPYGL
jgi:hypothetical protein